MSIARKNFVSAIVILGFAAIAFASTVKAPIYNWDMIGYIASAYQLDGLAGQELSSATYKDVKQEVDPETFKILTEGNYRATVFQDFKSLEQQLPFYNIRIAYIELMRLLRHYGVTYPESTYFVSAGFASASILMLAVLFSHFGLSPLWVPFVAIISGFTSLARFSTPDAIACFFALLAVYLFTTKNRLVYLIAAIMPLVRTDLIILSILLMSFDYFRTKSYYPILGAIAAVALYLAINRVMGNYGYVTLFNFILIDTRSPYPRDMGISGNVSDYIKPYLTCLRGLTSQRHLAIYVLAAYLLIVRGGYKTLSSEVTNLTLIASLYAALHLALLPQYEERFFVWPASILFFTLIVTLSQLSPVRAIHRFA